ncbi:unnamed protein product [Caenorhabditis bovis]|uniref:Exonuclease 1 n=1 Tax=Caenorhabditis bovis TaxID=2654633 RepID=A0A8S1FGK1_9PELO|nr:unnamed protein product [Caenorhabditis bovis]
MGISGLLPFVKNACRAGNIIELKGKSVAVDVSCLLHRGLTGCMDKIHMGKDTTSYVYYVEKYIKELLSYDCHIVMWRNVDIVVAPYEVMKAELVDAVITEDSDLIVFGCETIYFKWQSGSGECTVYEKKNLPKCFTGELGGDKFDFVKFRRICIISGCDYLQSGVSWTTSKMPRRSAKMLQTSTIQQRKCWRSLRKKPKIDEPEVDDAIFGMRSQFGLPFIFHISEFTTQPSSSQPEMTKIDNSIEKEEPALKSSPIALRKTKSSPTSSNIKKFQSPILTTRNSESIVPSKPKIVSQSRFFATNTGSPSVSNPFRKPAFTEEIAKKDSEEKTPKILRFKIFN